ncbi:hypothetical protein K469DRAFT_177466 [Zopfia rhizophila CBS 207.26]|uniref:Uncharacterized protein n=1 Tax=Zopfia rhizophila CBS 207.26 TaxID=1314779 RepID=A0A6A6E1T2_9PEZI|nr:hypothetical protein K469DRAFT_177466 [Zopfia rhizophila CBS 207.26]
MKTFVNSTLLGYTFCVSLVEQKEFTMHMLIYQNNVTRVLGNSSSPTFIDVGIDDISCVDICFATFLFDFGTYDQSQCILNRLSTSCGTCYIDPRLQTLMEDVEDLMFSNFIQAGDISKALSAARTSKLERERKLGSHYLSTLDATLNLVIALHESARLFEALEMCRQLVETISTLTPVNTTVTSLKERADIELAAILFHLARPEFQPEVGSLIEKRLQSSRERWSWRSWSLLITIVGDGHNPVKLIRELLLVIEREPVKDDYYRIRALSMLAEVLNSQLAFEEAEIIIKHYIPLSQWQRPQGGNIGGMLSTLCVALCGQSRYIEAGKGLP